TQIGVIFSIAPLMRFITPFFFLKHFRLTKNVLMVALFFMLVTIPLFYTTVTTFWLFALSNIVFGISSGLTLPYIETYAIEKLGKSHYGKSRLFGSIGFIIVALVLAKVLEDYRMGLHFAAVTIFFSVLFAWLIARDPAHFSNDIASPKGTFALRRHLKLWISIFLMQVSFGAFYSFFTIYETDHGISLETVSYLWTFGVICEIALFYFQARFLRHNLLGVIRFTLLATTVRWLLLFAFPQTLWILFLSQSLHALSFALYHSATLTYLTTLYEKEKKLAAQFYYGFGFGLGGFVGSLIAGYLYGPYLFLAAALIAGGALLSLSL
ncbi:MAG: MFS transporter, partial [Campylobacteraceae bacterium 4484_4]